MQGLCRNFNTRGDQIEVLKDVNYELRAGSTTAIVGASGIGKSTLLQIIGTLDRPDAGTIMFRNQDIFQFNEERLAGFRNQTIGFVFQFHHLLPEFNALENIMMPGLIKGCNHKKINALAEEILCRVGLTDRRNHLVGELSGGEQQRVALARALVLKPAILLADEPTGNLDEKNSSIVHALMLSLNQEFGMTMIVVTHNMELAGLMDQQVTIMNGKLEEIN